MQITNGKVTFGRTVKPADFEGKKVEVELSFAIAEGEDAESIVGEIAATCQRRAMAMLALPEKPAAAASALGEQAAPEPAPKRTRRAPILIGEPKTEPLSDPAALDAGPTIPSSLNGATPAGDPAALTTAATASTVTEAPASVDPASLGGDEWVAEAPAATVISDKDIVDACSLANERIRNPQKIRAVIAEFIAPPGQARQIPQDQRPSLLQKLKDLKAA